MDNVLLETITEAQALAYLKSERASNVCRVCKADSLECLVDDDGIHVSQVHLKGRHRGFFPVIVFVCARCGDVSQVAWKVIKEWVDLAGINSGG